MGSLISCIPKIKLMCCETIVVNKSFINQELYDYSKENDILIIPLVKKYNLKNLYPEEDEVEKWNIFIVGNNKTYISANIFENSFGIIGEKLLNDTGIKNMPKRMYDFLDKVWDYTLKGKQLQFFCYINSKLFLLNSYPFYNSNKKIIGGICFIREAGMVDKKIFDINVIGNASPK